jgi:predicted anti-sigma-YlaC factor YlaD
MTCQEYAELLTGYVDDELSDEQRRLVETHLQGCAACSRQLDQLVFIKERLTMIKFKEPSDLELQRYWSGVYNRLERGVGWILLSLGIIVLGSFGVILMLQEMFEDPELPLLIKAGVVSLVIGGVTLFVSVFRERLSIKKIDKYSREVER